MAATAPDSTDIVPTDNYDVTTALPGANATCQEVTLMWNNNLMLFMVPIAVSNNYDFGYLCVLTQSTGQFDVGCRLRRRCVHIV
jgi:hypothetical protein